MLNIITQLCGFFIVALLMFLFLRHRSVGLRRERLFTRILVTTLVLELVDIVSVVFIHYSDAIPEWIVLFICKLYIGILLVETMYVVVYPASFIFSRKKYLIFVKILVAICIVGIIMGFVLPINYYENGLVVYSHGPSVLCAYLFAAIFMFAGFIFSFIPSVRLTLPHRNSVRIWIFNWILAAIIQFLFPSILLTGFSSAFGVLVIFCALENPDSRINRTTNAFNAETYKEYINYRYEINKPFLMISILLDRVINIELKPNQKTDALNKISEFLRSLGEYRVFYDESCFTIILDEDNDFQRVYNQIKERFHKEWNIIDEKDDIAIPIKLISFKDSDILKDETDPIYIITQLINKYTDSELNEFDITKEDVDSLYEFEIVKAEIITALKENRVEAFYQPIYAVADGKFAAAEGLVRIRNRDGSLMSPGKFIPVAEETGLIKKIDDSVFEQTCKFLSSKDAINYGIRYIELNVSVAQCEEPDFADKYIKLMDSYGVNSMNINLEITESASIKKKDVLLKNMEKLLSRGVKFSLDDFGTGESNLNYIISMPISIVKFDMSMTRSYFENDKTKIVMGHTIKMINELGLDVVLEGVETKEQLEELCKLQVDYIQGFYFSKPLSKDEFIQYLKEHN